MKVVRTAAALAALITGTVISTAPAASAATGDADYGQHVRHCAHTMGFTSDHNPGMHHGKSGWDGMQCQP